MRKKRIFIAVNIIILTIIGTLFFQINEKNYGKTKQIQHNLVEHPENLPTKEAAVWSSFGFRSLKANIYWLQAIQYIGSNAVAAEYKKYLYAMLDLITELNPYFEKPYIIGQLLLPSDWDRNEDFTEEERKINTKQWELIWLKGIKNFCDAEKIEAIKAENDLAKIWNEEKFINPCKSSTIPYSLAFIYYFYLNNPSEASFYYKVASANEDSLEGAKIMAAIMQWKWWDREKAYFMFLNIGKFVDESDEQCIAIASQLEQLGAGIFFEQNIPLTPDILSRVSKARDALLWEFDEEKELEILSNTRCGNYINKAGRELNLEYVSRANDKYKQNNNWKNAPHAKFLFDEGYLDYLPVDYQQYDSYGIIYYYNEETWVFDYMSGRYDEF